MKTNPNPIPYMQRGPADLARALFFSRTKFCGAISYIGNLTNFTYNTQCIKLSQRGEKLKAII